MTVLCGHEQQCDDDRRFFRAVYCVQVPEELFDLFFNSANGYRASYYRSPYSGVEMNAAFIRSLGPALIASGVLGKVSHVDAHDSLASLSAKAWLAEKSLQLCHKCLGEWSPPQDGIPEIENGRWEHAPPPRYGSKAPYLTKIRVMGAFLNDNGDEFVPKRKRDRANRIHNEGWS